MHEHHRRASPSSRAAAAAAAVSRAHLEADLLRSIGAAGGWGAAARDRFVRLAHARGYDARAAVASIRSLAGSIGVPSTEFDAFEARPFAASGRVDRSAPLASVAREIADDSARAIRVAPDEPRDSTMTAVLIVCTVIVLMVLVAGVTLLLVGSEPAPSELNDPRPAAPPPRVRVTPDPETDEASEPSRLLDNAPAILHELEVATEGTAVDTEASLAAFELAIESLAARWIGFSQADRLAAQDQIVGFLYRVSGRRAPLARAFAALSAGLSPSGTEGALSADDVARHAWSMGTLVRLRREQNLPSSLLRDIDGAVLGSGGRVAPNASTFRAGAIAGLRALADPLNEQGLAQAGPESWDAWIGAVRAAALGDEELVGSMLIAALDGRLRHGARTAPGDAEVIAAMVAAMDFSEGSAARAWLVRAFDDRSLAISELHAVTLALANASNAGGVNHSMVLPRGAGDYDRRALRDRYRELWGISEDADQGQTLTDFLGESRAHLDSGPTQLAQGQVDTMAAIVRTARLNAIASMLWRAETTRASDLLADLDAPIDAVVGAEGVPDLEGLFRTGTGAWAEEYLSAGAHIQKRLDLLATALARADQFGPMEAEVVVAEALRGSPLKVRDEAAGIVELQTSSPAFVNAVLEALPMMPKTARNSAIVERVAGVALPPIDDPGWSAAARRGVVERLLELIAGRGEYARLDALAGLLDQAYGDRLAIPAGSSGEALPANAGARTLAARWIAAAERRPPASIEGVSIDEIRARRAARLSAADGLVQVFHAEQLAVAETMAQVIAGEVSGRTVPIRRVLDEMGRERARARHVLAQIEHTERAMLEMWLLRFSEGES